jgi:hypothetical protein
MIKRDLFVIEFSKLLPYLILYMTYSLCKHLTI